MLVVGTPEKAAAYLQSKNTAEPAPSSRRAQDIAAPVSPTNLESAGARLETAPSLRVMEGLAWPKSSANKSRASTASTQSAPPNLSTVIDTATQLRDARAWSAALDALNGALCRPSLSMPERGLLLHHKGNVLQHAEEFDVAVAVLEEACRIRFAAHDRVGLSYSLFQLAMCLRARALKLNPDDPLSPSIRKRFAVAGAAMSSVLWYVSGSPKTVADLQHNLAFCREQQGELIEALKAYEIALQRRHDAKDKRGEAYTQHRIAACCLALRRYDQGSVAIQKALSYYHEKHITSRIEAADKVKKDMTIARAKHGPRAQPMFHVKHRSVVARNDV